MARPALRRIAASTIGAIALIVSLVALPTAADAAATTTVRGIVTLGGHAVAGAPVGTWNPSRGVLTTGTTDAHGRFALRSPSGTAAVAWVGAKPSSSKAVFALGDEHLVRGVIGAEAPKGVARPLQQLVSRAVPSRLGGGRVLRFRLQEAGRFTASSPVLGRHLDTTGVIEVEHANGIAAPEYTADAAGSLTSPWLVPGRYHLLWNGNAPLASSWVTVRAGATVVATPPTFPAEPAGATLSLHVVSGGAPVPAGVVAVRLDGGSTTRAPSTDATGTIEERGVTPGTYRFAVGRAYDDPDEGFDGPPTSNDYLVRTVTVTVRPGGTAVAQTVDLAPASKVSGTVTVPSAVLNAGVAIHVEDSQGVIVRGTIADQRTGGFTLGGLAAGSYRVYAEDTSHHTYAVESVVLPAATSATAAPTPLAHALVPATPEPIVHGTVTGAKRGYVFLRTPAVQGASYYTAFGAFHASGRYSIRVIPARLAAQVQAEGHADARTAATLVSRTVTKDLKAGIGLIGLSARFAVRGHVVHVDVQANGSGGAALDLVRGLHGRSSTDGVRPGRYTWDRVLAPLPAVDGPWYYSPPKGSFTVHRGAVQDGAVQYLGTRAVTIRLG